MANDPTYAPLTYRDNGGDRINVKSGGTLDIQTGGILSFNGVDTTTQVTKSVAGLAAGTRIAFGVAMTVTATDTIATGLTTVSQVQVTLVNSPVLGMSMAAATTTGIAAGSFLLSSFMPTSNSNPTPIPATTFSKGVAWFAVGT